MNFERIELFPLLIVLLGFFFVLVLVMENKFFTMVKLYWFYNRSLFSRLSTVSFIIGSGLLLISLMDLRGPESRIKTSAPDEKTIILIDTSASMLAEDVKPSRLHKAILIAKHFARKALGHQISVVVFAEIQKKIVPFTNDLDLIDARLDSLKGLRNQNGSSALTLAITESIQYFKEAGQDRGNILILTDGEETAGSIDIKISKEYHVALVGVGTEKGGRIPLDDSRGFRFGYKKHQGNDVITRLNENFFKRVVADLPSAKYWTTNTYSLPSEEILDFFKYEIKKGEGDRDIVMRPVMMEWLVVPALLFLVLSYVLKAVRIFTLGIILLLGPVMAKDDQVELPAEVTEKLMSLQIGELTRPERLKLADDLQRAGALSEALSLYEENLPMEQIDKETPSEAYLNYGTALLQKGHEEKGLSIYQDLLRRTDTKSEKGRFIKDLIEKNTTSYFREQEKKEQKKKDQEKKDKDQKDNESKQSGQGQNSQGKEKSQSGSDQQRKDPKDDDKGDQDKEDRKDKDKDNKKDEQDKDGDKDQSNTDSKDNDQGEDGEQKKKLPPKIPAKLKQLMSDDRQLQMNMIERGTRELNKRSSSKQNKDW